MQSWGMDAFYNQDTFAIINLAISGSDSGGFTSGGGDWASLQIDWIAHERWCSGGSGC